MAPTKMVPYKNGTPCEKMVKGYPICQGLSWVIFKRKLLNLLYDSNQWSWDFKVEFFDNPEWYSWYSLVSSCCRCSFYYQGVGSISENQECSCEMSFLLDVIFGRCYFWWEECPFCNTAWMGAKNVRWH